MAERRYRKNYQEGSRSDLVRGMLSYGLTTTDGYRMLTGATGTTYQRMLTKMKKDGLIGSVDLERGKQASYLLDVSGKGMEYLEQVELGYYRHINETMRNSIRRLQRIKSDKYESERVIRVSEAGHIMEGAGIPSFWDEKAHVEHAESKKKKEVAYYSTNELKYIGVQGAVKNTKGVYPASRSIGVLCGEERIYPVYMTNKQLLKWNSDVESYGVSFMNKVMEQWGYESDREKEDCILLAKNEGVYRTMMFPSVGKGLSTTLFTKEQTVYDKIYAIPYRRESRQLLRKMTENGWDTKIRKQILGEYIRPKTNITCDHIVNGCHIFVWCCPDIIRFSRFCNSARTTQNRDMFKVYCYAWQADFVRSILTDKEAQIEIVEEG